ncbi:N-acetylmuramoyl-L-alanine amidase family protein [Pseudobacteroides cellulosolvens]|uniref:Cell wall hydrolase/autolysin n=1 Tax=Pseudobacteroides cellulosolvens ATCC 35603 = DSM 2933 TaxID=398512 RepID=A0A0L6JW10_9FIRM|nr:N-acetylmuramoyl-L-alanine amidase [Pseudobacteroides cellulosolvens]KNY30023.1 cell wall hydrolase/autolysin [Pseudobacteroides cellulosolvens ATCC 35603 = DSM 2933]
MKIIILKRKTLVTAAFVAILFLFSIFCTILNFIKSVNNDSCSKVIVVDPGHGGIDGGTSLSGVIEKDANLYIAKKVKSYLQQNGFEVKMTRDKDTSLDELSKRGSTRQLRDLNARVNIINSCNAKLFLSIHVNCHLKNPSANSAIVFFSNKYPESKSLANNVQEELNTITIDGNKRSAHEPQLANYFILNNANIPGVIVETAFISNDYDRSLLKTDEFKDELAKAIAMGVENYYSENLSNTHQSVLD